MILGIAAAQLGITVCVVCGLAISIFFCHSIRQKKLHRLYAVIPCIYLAGCLVCFYSLNNPVCSTELFQNEVITIEGEVKRVSPGNSGYTVELFDVSYYENSNRKKIENTVVYASQKCEPGDIVRYSGKLSELKNAMNEGEFDSKKFYRSRDIFLSLRAHDTRIIRPCSNPILKLANSVRKNLSEIIERISGDRSSGVFISVLTGNREALDDKLEKMFSACGIGHILAISGVHISILGMGLYRLLRKAGVRFIMSALIGSIFVIFYGIMTGNAVSTVRAVIMYEVAVGANATGYTYDMLSGASLASILILLSNPSMLFSAGFLLSFGAVCGIVLVGNNLIKIYNIKNRILSAFVFSFSIQLITLPVTMYFFYEISVLSVLLNMIVVPLMPVMMVDVIVAVIFEVVFPKTGPLLIIPGEMILWLYEKLCYLYTRISFSTLICGRPQVWQMVLYYMILGSCLYLMLNKGKKYCLLVAAALICIIVRIRPAFEMDFLSVGQGDSIFVRCEGKTMLVDAGSTGNKGLYDYTIEPFLLSKGVKKLDYVVVTHCDNDHISALPELFSKDKIAVDTFLFPQIGMADEAYESLLNQAKEYCGKVAFVSRGMKFSIGGCRAFCLNPDKRQTYNNKNDYSTTLLLDYKGSRAFLTGDISSDIEKELAELFGGRLNASVLKAAHHGSGYSSCEAFIAETKPKYAVISCGVGNKYGHPHKETLARFEDAGVKVLRTDEIGAIKFTISSSGKMEWEGFRCYSADNNICLLGF